MRHAIAAIGIACAVLAACASHANADDREQWSLVRTMCFAGRLGMPLKDVFKDVGVDDQKYLPDVVKNVWEGCRQETVKDLSSYPYTLTDDGKSRIIFMPGNAPNDARYEPLTADCRGRVGRWPAWRDAKEDPTETERMGVFYGNNPPGEPPKARSR